MDRDNDHDTRRSPITDVKVNWRQWALVGGAIIFVLLILDWLDPCSGQFTNLMGCLARGG